MKIVRDVFTAFRQGLAALYGAAEIEALTLLTLAEVTGTSKAALKAFPEQELTLTQQEEINTILTQLQTGKPLQYILSYTEFYGLKFWVNPAVLIPRPETEELVEWAISSWQLAVGGWQKPFQIVDMGTGSGCIAISLKKNLPDVMVSAIDISPEALNTAKENAKLNEVDINFVEADILNIKHSSPLERGRVDSAAAGVCLNSNDTPLHPSHEGNPANPPLILNPQHTTHNVQLIISNPPYVTPADKRQMHTNVTDFEPHTALFVPENDPLLFYKAIINFAVNSLVSGGLLFFEINESFGKETVELLQNKGFKNVELRQDMSGRDRMVKAVK
jgi:release factor glutamine methyltransferase